MPIRISMFYINLNQYHQQTVGFRFTYGFFSVAFVEFSRWLFNPLPFDRRTHQRPVIDGKIVVVMVRWVLMCFAFSAFASFFSHSLSFHQTVSLCVHNSMVYGLVGRFNSIFIWYIPFYSVALDAVLPPKTDHYREKRVNGQEMNTWNKAQTKLLNR